METETPLSYYRFKSRPTNRQLWPQNKEGESLFKNWINRVNIKLDPWDRIDSPQFIDFFNVPEISDRFFGIYLYLTSITSRLSFILIQIYYYDCKYFFMLRNKRRRKTIAAQCKCAKAS